MHGDITYRWSPTKSTYIQFCNCSGNKKSEIILQCHITLCLIWQCTLSIHYKSLRKKSDKPNFMDFPN